MSWWHGLCPATQVNWHQLYANNTNFTDPQRTALLIWQWRGARTRADRWRHQLTFLPSRSATLASIWYHLTNAFYIKGLTSAAKHEERTSTLNLPKRSSQLQNFGKRHNYYIPHTIMQAQSCVWGWGGVRGAGGGGEACMIVCSIIICFVPTLRTWELLYIYFNRAF